MSRQLLSKIVLPERRSGVEKWIVREKDSAKALASQIEDSDLDSSEEMKCSSFSKTPGDWDPEIASQSKKIELVSTRDDFEFLSQKSKRLHTAPSSQSQDSIPYHNTQPKSSKIGYGALEALDSSILGSSDNSFYDAIIDDYYEERNAFFSGTSSRLSKSSYSSQQPNSKTVKKETQQSSFKSSNTTSWDDSIVISDTDDDGETS